MAKAKRKRAVAVAENPACPMLRSDLNRLVTTRAQLKPAVDAAVKNAADATATAKTLQQSLLALDNTIKQKRADMARLGCKP